MQVVEEELISEILAPREYEERNCEREAYRIEKNELEEKERRVHPDEFQVFHLILMSQTSLTGDIEIRVNDITEMWVCRLRFTVSAANDVPDHIRVHNTISLLIQSRTISTVPF